MRSLALALTLGCVSPLCLSAQTARDFLGAWDLVRTESPNDSGEWVTTTDPFGPDGHGIIMYDGVGSMSVYIARQAQQPPGVIWPITAGTRSMLQVVS